MPAVHVVDVIVVRHGHMAAPGAVLVCVVRVRCVNAGQQSGTFSLP